MKAKIIEVLVKVVIKQGRFSFFKRPLVHSKNGKLFFEITPNKNIETLILSHLKLWKPNEYERTLKTIVVKDLKANESVKTESIIITFPTPGLYWIEATLEVEQGYRVRTRQITPEGTLGKGWPEGGAINVWRTSIRVEDKFVLKQTKQNYWIFLISSALLILTVFLNKNEVMKILNSLIRSIYEILSKLYTGL